MNKNLIISAASPVYERSILALAGSLRCNWPDHPGLMVYDLGISDSCRGKLLEAGVEVRKVPHFCPHWRKYFTWKLWCFLDVPSTNYLWLDAGVCVLRPMNEVFNLISDFGYFVPTNHWPLAPTLSMAKSRAIGLDREQVSQAVSIASGVHGFRKDCKGAEMLAEALSIALVENNMIPDDVWDRHDQALLSALMLKHFTDIHYSDHRIYCNSTSPCDVVGQKVWVHRRRMHSDDLTALEGRLCEAPQPYVPRPLLPRKPDGYIQRLRCKIAKLRGRQPPSDRAGECIYDGVRD